MSTRVQLEIELQQTRDDLAAKVQEHRHAILRNRPAGHFEAEIEALRAEVERLKGEIEALPPEGEPKDAHL